MFGKKVTCANAIATKSLDVFADAKAKVQAGIEEISFNRGNRILLKEELLNQLADVNAEIDKDDNNLQTLRGKLKAIDELI